MIILYHYWLHNKDIIHNYILIILYTCYVIIALFQVYINYTITNVHNIKQQEQFVTTIFIITQNIEHNVMEHKKIIWKNILIIYLSHIFYISHNDLCINTVLNISHVV